MLTRLSAPVEPFMQVADLKAALRIDTSDDDERLQNLIRSEVRRYEDFTGRVLTETSFEARFAGWCEPLVLPVAPVREVSAVRYLDTAHAEQTLDAADWYFTRTADGGEVRFTAAFASPVLSDRVGPVRVEFSAGYALEVQAETGADPELDPVARDRENVIHLIGMIYDQGLQMTEADMREVMGSRRILR